MILMIMFPKKGKTKQKNGMCLSKHPPKVLRSKREAVAKREKSHPHEAFLLTSHFAYLFIYHVCSPATCTAGGARDHRCQGESDGHPQFIIHRPVTAGQAEIWRGKHGP